jgi:hypothetical protein
VVVKQEGEPFQLQVLDRLLLLHGGINGSEVLLVHLRIVEVQLSKPIHFSSAAFQGFAQSTGDNVGCEAFIEKVRVILTDYW